MCCVFGAGDEMETPVKVLLFIFVILVIFAILVVLGMEWGQTGKSLIEAFFESILGGGL